MPSEPDNLVEPSADSLENPDNGAPAGPAPRTPSPNGPKKPSLLQRLKNITNIYLVIFIGLILAAAAVIYVSVRSSQNQFH
jgi:hypothetical protein